MHGSQSAGWTATCKRATRRCAPSKGPRMRHTQGRRPGRSSPAACASTAWRGRRGEAYMLVRVCLLCACVCCARVLLLCAASGGEATARSRRASLQTMVILCPWRPLSADLLVGRGKDTFSKNMLEENVPMFWLQSIRRGYTPRVSAPGPGPQNPLRGQRDPKRSQVTHVWERPTPHRTRAQTETHTHTPRPQQRHASHLHTTHAPLAACHEGTCSTTHAFAHGLRNTT